MFYYPELAEVYKAMLSLRAKNEPVDVVSVPEELRETERINRCGLKKRIKNL